MTTLRLIGYWRSETGPDWPDPKAFVDPTWGSDERDDVASYLHAGTIARLFMGWSYCRFCGEQNGDLEFSDGVYLWPEGLAHYVTDHQVRLPSEFVEHAVSCLARLEAADIDRTWWSGQGRD